MSRFPRAQGVVFKCFLLSDLQCKAQRYSVHYDVQTMRKFSNFRSWNQQNDPLINRYANTVVADTFSVDRFNRFSSPFRSMYVLVVDVLTESLCFQPGRRWCSRIRSLARGHRRPREPSTIKRALPAHTWTVSTVPSPPHSPPHTAPSPPPQSCSCLQGIHLHFTGSF